MITMTLNSRIEDVTLKMSSSTAAVNLRCVYFPDGTTTSAKLRVCVLNVSSTAVDSSTVYGIFSDGTTTNPTVVQSTNAVQRTTINVTSSATGAVRGMLFTGALQFIVRDATIFANGTGSSQNVAGVECTNTGALIQIKTSTVSGEAVSGTTHFNILQPSALANTDTPVIYLNATDILNGNSSSYGFGVNTQVNQIYYVLQGAAGADGNLTAGSYYMLPGNVYPKNIDAVTGATGLYLSSPFPSKCVVIYANIFYTGTALTTGRAIVVNLRNSTSPTAEGTIFLTQTLSNGSQGPYRLQNFSSTFDPATPNYLQVQISTLGNNVLPAATSNAVYISIGTY
jgi:hypothetical protein